MRVTSLVADPHLGAIHAGGKSARVWPVLSASCLGLAAVGLLAAAAPRLASNPSQAPVPLRSAQRVSLPVLTSEPAPGLTEEALLQAAPRLQAAAAQARPQEAASIPVVRGAAAISPASSTRLVGLNTATLVELRRLPHIGKSQARAIISGRPYTRVADLAERRILSSRAYKTVMARVDLR